MGFNSIHLEFCPSLQLWDLINPHPEARLFKANALEGQKITSMWVRFCQLLLCYYSLLFRELCWMIGLYLCLGASESNWKIHYRIDHKIIKMTSNGRNLIFRGAWNAHIYSHFIP